MQSSTFVGIMIAAMGTGILADKYGRKHVVMSCLAVTIVSAIFQTFSNSFWMYLFFQMLTSLGQAGFFQTGFILGMDEYPKIVIHQCQSTNFSSGSESKQVAIKNFFSFGNCWPISQSFLWYCN